MKLFSQLLTMCLLVCALQGLEGFELKKVPSIWNRFKEGMRRIETKTTTKTLGLIHKLANAFADDEVDLQGCSCQGETCGCCVHIHLSLSTFHINDTVCFDIEYLPKQWGLKVELIVNGLVWLSDTVSLKNPSPICVAIPYAKDVASICLKLYDLDYVSDTLSGCAKIEIKVLGFDVETWNLGCFHFPLGVDLNGKVKAKIPVILTRKEFLVEKGKKKPMTDSWETKATVESEETRSKLNPVGPGTALIPYAPIETVSSVKTADPVGLKGTLNTFGHHRKNFTFNRGYVKEATKTLIQKLRPLL